MPSPLLDALLDLLALDGLPRTGWIQAGVPNPESIAAHSLGAALIAMALGPRVDPPLDTDRAVSLCVVHDAPEAHSGDLPRAAARAMGPDAKRDLDAALAGDLLPCLSPLAHERFAEVQAGATREARFAKACDRLHLGLRWLGYRRAGQRGLESFRSTLEASDLAEFAVAEELLREILDADRALDG